MPLRQTSLEEKALWRHVLAYHLPKLGGTAQFRPVSHHKNMTHVPFTVEVLEKLRWNVHLGKRKHFEAGN